MPPKKKKDEPPPPEPEPELDLDSEPELEMDLPPLPQGIATNDFALSVRQAGWKNEQPTPRHGAISLINPNNPGHVWVMFGAGEPEHHHIIHEYEATNYKWRVHKMTGELPTTFFSHCYGVWEDTLYVFGGYGNRGFVGSLYEMNCKTFAWRCLDRDVSGDPPSFTAAAAAVHEGVLYCFGGRSNTGSVSGDLYALNLKKCEWSRVDVHEDPLYDSTQQLFHYKQQGADRKWWARPLPRHSTSLCVVGNTLHLWGGNDRLGNITPSDALESPSVMFQLDLAQTPRRRWAAVRTTGDSPPMKIHGQTTFAHKGWIFCVGGFKSARVHVYDPVTYAWRVPQTASPSSVPTTTERLPPLKVGSAANLATTAAGGAHKGVAWAECTITRVRADGLYDVFITPTEGVKVKGALTGVPREDLRKRVSALFPQRCSCVAHPLPNDRFVVFGGIRLESNERFQDTYLLTLIPKPKSLLEATPRGERDL